MFTIAVFLKQSDNFLEVKVLCCSILDFTYKDNFLRRLKIGARMPLRKSDLLSSILKTDQIRSIWSLGSVRAVMACAGVVICARSGIRSSSPLGDLALIGVIGVVVLVLTVGTHSLIGIGRDLDREHGAHGKNISEHPGTKNQQSVQQFNQRSVWTDSDNFRKFGMRKVLVQDSKFNHHRVGT